MLSSVSFPETGRKSPVFELRPGETTENYINSKNKIRRIQNQYPFAAEFLHVASPSSVYLRFPFHITKQLEIPYSFNLTPATVENGNYVMAPIRPDTLGRARIIDHFQNEAYIFFIDAGKPAKCVKSDLFSIPENLVRHPWQAIAVKLCGISPANQKDWSKSEVDLLDNLMNQYNFFWTVPKLTETKSDASDFMAVDIYGLTKMEYEAIFQTSSVNNITGDCIATSYNLYSVVPSLTRFDGQTSKHYVYYNTSQITFLKTFSLDKDTIKLPRDFSLSFHNRNPFPQLKDDFTKDVMLDTKSFWVFVQRTNMISTSPNLFFAYRLDKISNSIPNDPNRIIRFRQEAHSLSQNMDSVYFDVTNCHPLNFYAVYDALNQGTRVFGVVRETAASYLFVFHFQRVEILDCIMVRGQVGRNNEATNPYTIYRIRYIDTGGITLVTTHSVFHMFPSHIEPYPLCYLLSYQTLKPFQSQNGDWPLKTLQIFNDTMLPEMKVFQVIVVVDKQKSRLDLSKPVNVKSVVNAMHNKEAKTVEQQLIEGKYAVEDPNYAATLDIFADTRYENEREVTAKLVKRHKSNLP